MGTKRTVESRRKFIRAAAATAGTLFLTSLTGPYKILLYAADPPENEESPWWGIGIDITKCIGCGLCAKSCKTENHVPEEPFYFRSWVEKYTIYNDESIKVESPNGGIDGFEEVKDTDDIFKSFFVPKMCNQCAKSPCTQVCPVGATFESPDGVALIDQSRCLGCAYCVQACPYGCRYIHPEKGTADKCTLCYHRLKKGLAPACMEVCPTGARMYGNLRDPNSELVQFLKEHAYQILKPHLNTGAKLYYNGLTAEVR